VLSLDSIKPTVKALADGLYRHYKPYYIVTTEKTPTTAKKFISYLFTARGVKILKDNGYLVTRK